MRATNERLARLGASLLAAAALGWGAGPARANARLETEEQRISRILQSTLVAHGGEVNRCFEKALADSIEVAGKVELAVDIGAEGKVTKTAPALDEAGSPVLVACLQTAAETWSFAGIDPGSTVIVPLAFEGQAAQFAIKAADAPDHGPGTAPKPGAKGKAKPAGPAAAAPFSVKLLVDEKTMRARQASLSMLTVSPASRIAMHKHPGAEILYVLKGHARILGQTGVNPEKLDEGMAMFIPGGVPHVIENMGRQTPAVLLDYFVPMGPERVFRDPTDAAGRAAFEVIRDGGGTAAPGAPAPWFVASAAKAEPITIAGGKARVRKLITPELTHSGAAYLGILEADPGTEIPRHLHPTSAEIIYTVTGTGLLNIGLEPVTFGPDTAIHIPENQPHSVTINGTDKALMIQLYAPAGPEQRFVPSGPAPKTKGTTP